jgi:hypothetical protein
MRQPRGVIATYRPIVRLAALAVASAMLTTCEDEAPLTAPSLTPPTLAISDAAHLGGNPDFFFLPPLVPNPRSHPDFDPEGFDFQQAIAVEICALNGDVCGVSLVTYTMTSDHVTEGVRVDEKREFYFVNWNTSDFTLDPDVTYRITVSVAGAVLGFADVDVVSRGNTLKNVNTGQYIALHDGQVLPIRFRIQHGAVHRIDIVQPIGVSDWVDAAPAVAIDIVQPIGVSDWVDAAPAVAIDIVQPIGVSDWVDAAPAVAIDIVQPIGVSDWVEGAVPVTGAEIHGTITGDGSPFGGVPVALVGTGLGAGTDGEGFYRIVGIPPGVYTVRTTLRDFGCREEIVTVGADETKIVNIAFWSAARRAPSSTEDEIGGG